VRVKSYYGNSIREALDKARRELGPDASIVASRQADGSSGRYEVVCGVSDEKRAPSDAQITQALRSKESVAPAKPQAGQSEPKSALRKLRTALTRSNNDDDGLERVRTSLLTDGFGEDLTADILAGVRQRQRRIPGQNSSGASPEECLAAELASRLRVSPELGRSGAASKIVALIGPPGAGKTTSLVKLAVRYGLTGSGPMHIISADSYRVGGTDALRAYAGGMGVEFHAAATPAALSQIVDATRGKGLVLIDTPGLAPAEMAGAANLASFLSRNMAIDVQLVLPATMSAGALSAAVTRFRPFLPSRILITAGDQAAGYLPLVAQSLLHDKPVSFIGTGQTIPEDLVEASASRLCGTWAVEGRSEAISAA
jgi:flagellar biosynthesis protein FlhF